MWGDEKPSGFGYLCRRKCTICLRDCIVGGFAGAMASMKGIMKDFFKLGVDIEFLALSVFVLLCKQGRLLPL